MRQIILLADDSPTIQRLVVETFADTPFDVVSVSNGDSAIRKFEEIRPSAVLADIYMPGKNGFEVCAHIKSHSSRSRTPVILLVGAFDAFDESTGSRAGAAAHITKPFEPRALVDLVHSVIDTMEQSGGFEETVVVDEPAAMATSDKIAADDILGLEKLFQPAASMVASPHSAALLDEDVDRIADRVILKLSTQVIEGIAWDVVPDIATRVLRDELKRTLAK